MKVLTRCGHAVHEDSPEEVSVNYHLFLSIILLDQCDQELAEVTLNPAGTYWFHPLTLET